MNKEADKTLSLKLFELTHVWEQNKQEITQVNYVVRGSWLLTEKNVLWID